jgi:flagellar biosynthesis protein FliR
MDFEINTLTSFAAASFGPAAFASLRMLGILFLAPAFSGEILGWRMRVVLALFLGSLAGTGGPLSHGNSLDWALAAISELAFGAMIGCGISLFVSGLRFAGELIDREVGIADASATEPLSAAEDEPLGPCARLLGGLAVVTVMFSGSTRGGLPILEGILESFGRIPAGQASMSLSVDWIVAALQQSAELSVRAALPVLSVLAIVGWAQGLISRAAPHVPSAMLATSVRPLLGFAVLVATFGGALDTAGGMMTQWFSQLTTG